MHLAVDARFLLASPAPVSNWERPFVLAGASTCLRIRPELLLSLTSHTKDRCQKAETHGAASLPVPNRLPLLSLPFRNSPTARASDFHRFAPAFARTTLRENSAAEKTGRRMCKFVRVTFVTTVPGSLQIARYSSAHAHLPSRPFANILQTQKLSFNSICEEIASRHWHIDENLIMERDLH